MGELFLLLKISFDYILYLYYLPIKICDPMKKHIKIAMAWGGTGGHVFPIKSLIEYINQEKIGEGRRKLEKSVGLYRFWNKHSLEEKICRELICLGNKNLKFVPMLSWKFRRETKIISRLKNIGDVAKIIFWFFYSLFALLFLRIDVIFCKWWHVALPVVLAAVLLRRKIVVHESDTKTWLTNKIAARFATKVFTWFEGVLEGGEVVGQILSNELVWNGENWKKLGEIGEEKTNILVLGGSQGSRSLYHWLTQIDTDSNDPHVLVSDKLQFYIVLGLLNKEFGEKFKKYSNVITFDFADQQTMGQLYDICDIWLTRGGTTSLAEQKLFDMKLAIVPIPWTHDQYKNAEYYEKKYNDIILDQKKDFQVNLKNFLLSHIGFKKEIVHTDIDRLAEIGKVKEKIMHSLVER